MAAAVITALGACAVEEPAEPAGVAAPVTSATPKAAATTPAPKAARTTARTTAPTTAPTKTPLVEKRIVVETRRIPFRKLTVDDSELEQGRTVVTTRGVTGRRRLTFEVTLVDGVRKSRRLIRQTVVRAPVDQVTSIGTKVAEQDGGSCDPNYTGDCVPIASDVDCAGGSGNGPEYVDGPVTVVGDDVYGLDRDNDGIGCED